MRNEKLSGIRVSKQCRARRAKARPYISGVGREGRDESRPYKGEGCEKRTGVRFAEGGQARSFRGRYDQWATGRKAEKRQHVRSAQGQQAAALPTAVDGVRIWKQFEDLLIPRLQLTVMERALYSHLFRHSRLEGKRQLRFTIGWAARGTGLTIGSVRNGVRQLAAKGALRLLERSKRGHVVEVRLPEEVRAVRTGAAGSDEEKSPPSGANLEKADFWRTPALREAIHAREAGRCFYCKRRVKAATRCIDHVIPQAQNGSNSYRNLVSSCAECNAQKCAQSAEDFLRWLFREGRLGATELKEGLSALEKLAAGELRPVVSEAER